MSLYLYKFGFESPLQRRNNDAYGLDHEDSQAVLIEAENEAAALAWGQEISEQFIRLLFKNESVSWMSWGYAKWVEPPGETWPGQQTVTVGTFPDFSSWLQPYDGQT
jgi:hypothetical protein